MLEGIFVSSSKWFRQASEAEESTTKLGRQNKTLLGCGLLQAGNINYNGWLSVAAVRIVAWSTLRKTPIPSLIIVVYLFVYMTQGDHVHFVIPDRGPVFQR